LSKEQRYKGIPASSGVSIGQAYLYKKSSVKINNQIISDDDVEREFQDLDFALELSKKELNKIKALSYEKIGEQNSKIFDAQLEILNDSFFINGIKDKIRKEKKNGSFIFSEEISKLGRVLLNSRDEYLKERYADIMDVKNRVVRNMKREKLFSKVEVESIVIAHELTPADTILFSRRKVKGYATDRGGVTSHAAIISRALRVPAVVGMKDIVNYIKTGDLLIIDGFEGLIIKDPDEETIQSYIKKQNELYEYERKLNEVINLPSITLDGKHIELSANIEFDEEIDFVTNCGHCSIGLYRTEHLFLEAGDFPSEEKQIDEYTHIANVTFPQSVTIRTYDIGGDKLLPTSEKESNPFLGWRGIRICLDRVEIFKEQLCALLKASTKKNVKILFPMVSSLPEIRRTKEILEEVKKDLDEEGFDYDKEIGIGVMIEVPSACLLANELAKEVDFFSIGTNDLIQYLLAVDRGNEFISDMFLEFHPAIVRTLKQIIDTAHSNNIPVSICGEMASDPLASALLIGLGIDELSVVPSIFPEIKQIIRNVNYKEAQQLVKKVLLMDTEKEIKNTIENFYKEKISHQISMIQSKEYE
jgi:phosphoenolpyruvate-protein phosphotransferase (PTS system enzyme I)